MMNPSEYSFHYTFDDGERVLSSLEYEFSLFLKNNGYIYKQDYLKDVMYSKFIKVDNRTTCDYLFKDKVIEIAGVIDNINNNWKNKKSSVQENSYRDSLLAKVNLMEINGVSFLLLFPEDFDNNLYIEKFNNFINNVNLSDL